MRITFRIEDELLRRARAKAKSEGRHLNDIIREFLTWVAEGGDPKADYREISRLGGHPAKLDSALE